MRALLVAGLLAMGGELPGAEDFPITPDDLRVSLYARDPLVRNPCAITFDAQGRLCVGMGPQYRSPTPETAGDSIFILIDRDGDGTADDRREFATGFNAIQGLAWKGRELWVANAPDLTVVRDVDGDDEADEYVRLYTDLGNLEHGLHGLNWGPDGRLYMSKGNSKGLTRPPGRVAPKPFRELWGVMGAENVPDFPEPVVFRKGEYQKNYHDPRDDWGLCGGILRCDPDGSNLQIVSRGNRNPWDICFDDGFNWLGTDNDQTLGDKIFAPFYGAHFGWGHMWSYDWKGDDHLPTAPSAGPLFEGSGTGVIFCNVAGWPETYRDMFLINDWLRRETYIYRAKWKGAWMQPAKETFDLFAHAGRGRSMKQSDGRSFDPVDIEVGPDGAVYISSWGRSYGTVMESGKMANQGRIYRLWPKAFKPKFASDPKRSLPINKWTSAGLIEDLKSDLPVWRVNAQEEIVRRGAAVRDELAATMRREPADQRLQTWGLWALGRMKAPFALVEPTTRNNRIQTLRILSFRSDDGVASAEILRGLSDADGRIRHEAVLALHQTGDQSQTGKLLERAAVEKDRIVYYSIWQALRSLASPMELKSMLKAESAGVRRAALLALLEDDALSDDEIRSMTKDVDRRIADLAVKRLGGKVAGIIRGAKLAGNPASERKTEAGAKLKSGLVKPLSVVRGIAPVTKRRYEEATLGNGVMAYTDRPYRITEVPELLAGETFIRPANNDADPNFGPGVTLDLRYPSTVYLADDVRGEKLPRWARGKFEKTAMTLKIEKRHVIYRASFPAGKAFFGANREDVQGRKGNYLLIVQPRALSPPSRPTVGAEVLPLVAKADVEHGRNLFLQKAGATCSVCHRMEGRGSVFAPDLSDIGTRADAAFIVRSILEPSAEITEGFASQLVKTKDGEELSGIVLGETGRTLTMAMAGGNVEEIAKTRIRSRVGMDESAMPNVFHSMLKPADVAAITRYLLEGRPLVAATPEPAGKSPKLAKKNRAGAGRQFAKADAYSGRAFGGAGGFEVECTDDRLAIRRKGRDVGSYYYRHEKVWRPFFAHLATPGGIAVTRNFPPKAGDPDDHWDMHPGLSLGFAVLDGVNFWHNREGSVVHQRFREINASQDQAGFSAINSYRDSEGVELCREIANYTILHNADGFLITIDARLRATRSIYFGVKEEMGLAVRVATPITVKFGGGSILSAAGGRDEKGTWGKPDRWWDYHGPIRGRDVGLQIMSAPGNPEVWSHSRNYGVLVANPFPVDVRKNRDRRVKVAAGEELRLRFGVQIHERPERAQYDPEATHRNYLESLK